MTHPSDILQYRHLIDRPVLDRQTMEEVGRVDTLWMFPQRNRVLGVVCRPGRFGAKRLVFKLTQMDASGDGLLMQGDPEPTVAAKVQQLESLIGQEVWSDRGERVGKIVDCLFNPDNGVILRYLITPGSWASITDGTYLLSPKQIVSFSAKRTLIAADDIDDLEVYQPGLRQRLAQIRAMLKEDYVDSVARELRSLSSQVQDQVQGIAERAQEQMETLFQRTRQRAQTFSEEFSRDAQEVVRTIQTEAQAVTERVEQAIPRGGQSGPADIVEDEDLDDWDAWSDTEADDNEADGAEGSEPEMNQAETLRSEERSDEPSEETSRSGPIIVPAAKVDSVQPKVEIVSDDEGIDENSVSSATAGDGVPPAFDGSFEEWSESASGLGSDLEPNLEPDERDVWDDWDDETNDAGESASGDAGESASGDAGALDEPATENGASPDVPSMPPSVEDDNDPWI
ncbi:MAG: PRC-barrel domain-containing protein [Elainellaceae cyanobacterium]